MIHRALPLLGGVALIAFVVGISMGGGAVSESERVARKFSSAWQRGDYTAMYRLLPPETRARVDREAFESAYTEAAATATATGVTVGEPRADGDSAQVPVAVRTRIFGTVQGEVTLPVSGGAVAWQPHLVFPGLEPGVALTRRTTTLPTRAKILSADGEVLAEGPADARSSPLGELAGSIAGTVQPAEDEQERSDLYARGFEEDTPVGTSGLERILDAQLAGRPGGELLAGGRVLARARERAAQPIETTIDTHVQEAAVTALAGRLGGIAAIDPRNGEVEALAGIAFSAPQPPGSTFKLVTATAALDAKQVKPSDMFPVETAATIDGVELENANGESCGGDFSNSFAHSCNSVFGPLGVKVGATRLVDTAERYGWNEDPGIPGAMPSTLPPASEIVSPLELASTAIGQYKTLATPLQMATVAQTIANRGERLLPTFVPRPKRSDGIRVTSPEVAATLGKLMTGVVEFGTGTLAQISGVEVAGKTGTAELEDTRGDAEAEARSGDPSNTDAWFASYAPVDKPRIAVGVLFVRNGSGGAVAAPAAQIVMSAALDR